MLMFGIEHVFHYSRPLSSFRTRNVRGEHFAHLQRKSGRSSSGLPMKLVILQVNIYGESENSFWVFADGEFTNKLTVD